MDNVRQRQSIKDCLVCPSIANIQNPIYKTRLYTPIYTATFWTQLCLKKRLGRSCDIRCVLITCEQFAETWRYSFPIKVCVAIKVANTKNILWLCTDLLGIFVFREMTGIFGCCVWQMIIKTHIRGNRFHGNRSVHPQKLPTT